MRARTTPQKEGLSPFECIYGRPFLRTDIVIDPEALELTNYVTQLSAFQQALTELRETTPDPASKTSKPLFEPGTELSKCQELIRGYIILELRGGTLTKIK